MRQWTNAAALSKLYRFAAYLPANHMSGDGSFNTAD
jgi:hypothetical protein